MFGRELEKRQQRFEKESADRKRKEKEKADRVSRERLAARQRREELERKAKERELLKEQRRQQEELRKERLREVNRGVFLEASLLPSLLSKDVVASSGIRRWKDKVVLPSSMSDELMWQEAFKNGANLFELVADNGNRTHVGVLNFSAPEGTIQIPSHVFNCLWGQEEECKGRVKVMYKRLLDGTFARLQPVNRGFHEAIGDDMKDVLESTLSQHSTLTEGDIIQISHESTGMTHSLKVVELSPAPAVSILNIDLEVDILPSAEVEDALRSELRPSEAVSFSRPNRLQKYRIAKQTEAEPIQLPDRMQPSEDGQHANRQNIDGDAEMEPEISEDSEDVITCSVRFPDGSLANRRFKFDDSLSSLFRFVDLQRAGRPLDEYRLITQFPRCVLSHDQHATSTFRQCGFDRRQTFFIETS